MLQNIDYHNQRYKRTLSEKLGLNDNHNLQDNITLPEDLDNKTYKCRVTYSDIIFSYEIEEYIQKKIQTFGFIEHNEIDYSYKYKDRSIFTKLLEKSGCDEIIIIKNGRVTDTTFSNLAFYDGSNWLTPREPLLKGTKRQNLIDRSILEEAEITPSDLKYFSKFKLVNAMLDLEQGEEYSITKIKDKSIKVYY